jgi:hypothetical protein
MGKLHCFTSRACSIVVAACSRRDAVQRGFRGESRAASTKKPATLPALSPKRRHSRNRAVIARRSRCCSLTSSAFCGLTVYAFAVRAEHSSSSRWRQSRKTFADWQIWSLDRHQSHRLCALRRQRVQFVASVFHRVSSAASDGVKPWSRRVRKTLSRRQHPLQTRLLQQNRPRATFLRRSP